MTIIQLFQQNHRLGYSLSKAITICVLTSLLAGLLPAPGVTSLPLPTVAKAVQAASAQPQEAQPPFAEALAPARSALADAQHNSETVAGAPVAVANNQPLAQGGPASISGLVYSDFNANGAKDTSEVGVDSITVTAYDASGATIASTTASTVTATLGQYTLSGLPASTPLRLEFTTLPVGYQPAPHGPSTSSGVNGTAVQLVTTTSAALSNVNFGISNPADYSEANPDLVTSLYVNGDTNTTAPTDALVKFAYNSSSTTPTPTALATKAQIGTTWGLAYARATKMLYAAAFLKRHAGLGPNGPGAIYAIDINGGAPTLFADLTALGADVGTVLSNSARGLSAPLAPSNDPTTFDQIGKVGLGDIDLTDDERTLYVVNLNDKRLYALNVPAGTLVGSYAIPDPGCTGGAWRPFALKFKQGVLYVGGVCDAQTAQNRADLQAYVYRFMPGANTFSQVLNFPLNYGKGPATGPCCGLAFAGWYPWLGTFDTTKINTSVQAGIIAVYPQPILSDIEFDVDSSLILGFSDRFGHQSGDQNYGTSGTTRYDGLVGGDILRACPNAAGNWVLESGGACGGVTGGGANSQGPGGGEFYIGDYYAISSFETAMGSLALKPGSGEVALTVMDPLAYITGGVAWLSNTNGNAKRRYQVYDATRDIHFGKANGLGDLELLAAPAPIEIGNRVWEDTNNNGIQDADEPSLPGVLVSLYDNNNNRLATVATDAQGTYYFSNAAGTDTFNAKYNLAALKLNTSGYQVRIDTTQPVLNGFSLTTADADSSANGDARDADAQMSGGNAVVTFATGAAGANNHTYDFGFNSTPVAIGNYIWKDNNADGLQDVTDTPLVSVTVGLYQNNGGGPLDAVLCAQGQTGDYRDTGAGTTDSAGTLNWASQAWTYMNAGSNTGGNPGTTIYVFGNGAATRAVDLAVFGTYPVLSYDFAYGTTTTAYSHTVEYSSDSGATWQPLANYTSNSGVTTWQSTSYVLPTLSANARIRIRGGTGTTANRLLIDNLRIAGGIATPVTTVTDAAGHYSFDSTDCVEPSTPYQVRLAIAQTPLTGLYLTTQDAGGMTSNDPTADDNDSDAASVTISNTVYAHINAISPAVGVNNSYDFGFTPLEIGNYVWQDTNANGRQDSGEPGLPGVTVGLYDNSSNAVQCAQVGMYDTYADAFNSGASNGSTGSLTWWGTTWSFAGSAATYGTQGNPGGSLYVYAATTSTAARAVDLSVFGGPPTVSFDYIRGNGAASFNVQYSSNGGTSFTTLATLSVNNASYQTITYTLPITAANAQIRIQGAIGGSSIYAYFDNFTIRGQQRFPVTDATDSNGLYTFTGANCLQPSTNYQVRIDTTQNLLFGYTLTAPNASGVTSNSPTGDDSDSDATGTTIKGTPYAVTNLTSPAAGVNYSYDFGFVPSPVGSLQVNKTVNGATAPAGWRFTLSSANCTLPPSLTNPSTTTNGAGGSVTFANLLVKNGVGAACQYQVSEKSQTGWFLNYVASDPVSGIGVTANSTTPVAVVNNQLQTCNVGSGNVGGLIFQDFNMDGQQNSTTNEPGFLGGTISVRAYGKNNQLLASVPLQPDGSYVFTNLPNLATDGVRIEFQNLAAAGVEPTAYTSVASTTNRTSGTLVRFVKAPTCSADLGVNRPANYCQANPQMGVPNWYYFDPALGGNGTGNGGFTTFTYDGSGIPKLVAQDEQIGATWGVASQPSTKTIFAAAFTREYVGYGPLGRGGIYAIDLSNPSSPQVSPFVDLQALGVDAGGAGSRPASVATETGKSSLGDIDISEDGKTLYVMNVYQRELVLLDIASKTVTQKIPVPDPGCLDSRISPATPAPQDRRPWAIDVQNGEVYIGVMCSAETSQSSGDLRAYVMRLRENSFVPVFNFVPTASGLGWQPWSSTISSGSPTYAPILADFTFDVSGSLIVDLLSRTNFISGAGGALSTGAIVRYANVNGQLTSTSPIYFPFLYLGTSGHANSLVGGIAFHSGFGQVVAASLPGNNTNSIVWYDASTGTRKEVPGDPGRPLFLTIPQEFAKGTGLGDLEILCDQAPLEIGNRVWNDSAQSNGVQDPNEPGIGSVVVGLYTITGTLIATTTTNISGTYAFNSSNVAGGLKQNTDYTIRINQAQALLNGLQPTLLNQVVNNPLDSDEHDSDGNLATYAGYVTTPVHTGSAGQNDYSYDFGFTSARYDLGDNPDRYNTVITNTGAAHVIVAGLFLGATEDTENDGQPSADADGDGADEDGVQFPALKAGSSAVITVTVTNTGTQPAILSGWLDFNGNGQFEASERVTTTVPAGTANGLFYLTYSVPADAVSSTYARFRLSTDPAVVNPTGVVTDGEVEDYPITLQTTFVRFGDRVWIESDSDGLAASGIITPVVGLIITATDGTQLYTTTTTSQGYYSFTVEAGTYTVTYGSIPAGYGVVLPSSTPGRQQESGNAGSYQASGAPDQSHPNGATVTLTPGQANWQLDFAFRAPQAALRLVKQVAQPVAKAGDALTYTLVVTNDGPDPATGVQVRDQLPATVTYQSATAQQGAYDADTGIWTVGTVAVDSSVTLTLTVTIK